MNADTLYRKTRALDAFHLREVEDFVDFLLSKEQRQKPIVETGQDWKKALRAARGMWRDREDLDSAFQQIRDEFERGWGHP